MILESTPSIVSVGARGLPKVPPLVVVWAKTNGPAPKKRTVASRNRAKYFFSFWLVLKQLEILFMARVVRIFQPIYPSRREKSK